MAWGVYRSPPPGEAFILGRQCFFHIHCCHQSHFFPMTSQQNFQTFCKWSVFTGSHCLGGLKPRVFTPTRFWRPEVQSQGDGAMLPSPEGEGRAPLRLPGWWWPPTIRAAPWFAAATLQCRVLFSYRVKLMYLQRPYFQIRSGLRLQEDKTLGDIVQLTTRRSQERSLAQVALLSVGV